jgi:hypothetical protein
LVDFKALYKHNYDVLIPAAYLVHSVLVVGRIRERMDSVSVDDLILFSDACGLGFSPLLNNDAFDVCPPNH